jgi:hypothetical protein
MAAAKEADFEAAVAAGAVPWFLTAWFDATAAGRAADAGTAALGVGKAAKAAASADGETGPVHPVHRAPCLRVFTSLVRAGVCQAEAEASMAAMGGGGGGGGGGVMGAAEE